MKEMSFEQACEYVEKTNENVYCLLPDGGEVTMFWLGDDDNWIVAEYWRDLGFQTAENENYGGVENILENLPDVTNVIWRVGQGRMFRMGI